jgi:hypothetical protein
MNMANVTRGAAIFFGFVCVLIGLIDLVEQHKLGEELQWRVPIIIIGLGVGLPIVFIPISHWLESSDSAGSYANSSDSGGGESSGD